MKTALAKDFEDLLTKSYTEGPEHDDIVAAKASVEAAIDCATCQYKADGQSAGVKVAASGSRSNTGYCNVAVSVEPVGLDIPKQAQTPAAQ